MASPWPTSINLMVTFVLACVVADGVPVADGALEPDVNSCVEKLPNVLSSTMLAPM